MVRKPRGDEPGTIFHVWNRGVAQRSVFERRAEVRYFLSRLARVQRMGLIDVISYSFPLNHFHLLVRSRTGDLGRAMRLTESMFVRRFNPPRGRDGPLFRSRYGSSRVDSERYFIILVRYIDQNCVDAGLAVDPADFEFGSAWHYAKEKCPRWLCRRLFEEFLRPRMPEGVYRPEAYREVFGRKLSAAEAELVRRRMIFTRDCPDPLDDLVGSATPRTRDWLVRQAALADGLEPGVVLLPPDILMRVIEEVKIERGTSADSPGGKPKEPWATLVPGLLRGLCGATLMEVHSLTGICLSGISKDAASHRLLLQADAGYGTLAAEIVARSLVRAFPEKSDPGSFFRKK